MNRFPMLASFAFLMTLAMGSGAAAVPARLEAFGLALGATPNAIGSMLGRDYKPCSPIQSVYHERPGDRAPVIAALEINPGLTYNDIGAPDLCSYSPAGDGITDAIEAKFVHTDIDPDQPLYALEVQRLYPDIVYAKPARLRNSFDSLRAQLFKTYGRPVDERRERISSSAANLAFSLGIGGDVKRDDYQVRYLWAASGKLVEQEYDDSTCRCDGPYVKAVIEISRSPSTIPRNRFYVLSVTISTENPALRARQDAWNAQWLTLGK
jgi:hypothetical protein